MPPKNDRKPQQNAAAANASTAAAPAAAPAPPTGLPLPPLPTSLPPGPRSACNDQFGILGLQSVVQVPTAAPSGPNSSSADASASTAPSQGHLNMLMLTRGFDLANLGLMLVQTDPLHTTFAAPWIDAPSRIQPDFKIPSCYAVNSPHLHYSMFQKFTDETLFYIFYSMPRDVLQLAAAQELYSRDWRFHKQLFMWLTRFPKTEPTIKHQQYEKGTYLVFDPVKWTKERRDDFFLQYDFLEERSRQGPAGGGGAAAAAPQQQPPAGGVGSMPPQ